MSSYRTKISTASNLKMTKIKLDLLTDLDMLIMLGKFHSMHQYVKANNNYMKDYDKKKK